MGLIKAGIGALGGVLADQWKEFFYCDALNMDTLMIKGQKRISGRSSNTKGSDNLIEYIDVKVIAEDPTEDKLCYDPSKDEYPLPTHMWPTIKNMIFNADIYTMFQ